MSNTKNMKFDKRILDRNIRSGVTTKAEAAKEIKKLKDLTEEAAPVESEMKRIDKELPSAPQTDEDEL